jgi:post-segregation antitoxin (ccd killing protein)
VKIVKEKIMGVEILKSLRDSDNEIVGYVGIIEGPYFMMVKKNEPIVVDKELYDLIKKADGSVSKLVQSASIAKTGDMSELDTWIKADAEACGHTMSVVRNRLRLATALHCWLELANEYSYKPLFVTERLEVLEADFDD